MADIFVGSVAVGVVPDARGWDQRMRQQILPASDQIGSEVGNNMSRKIVDQMGKSGDESAGAFSDTFQKRIKAALEKLPKAELKGDDKDVEEKLNRIRLIMEEFGKKKIGIDMDAKLALEELAVVDKALKEVEHDAKNIDVKFNTAAARAQLALLKKDAGTIGDESGRNMMEKMLGGIGAEAASAPSAGAGGGGMAIPGLGAVGPAGLAIGGAVGLFALPFIAQAAAGAIVFTFGAALAAIPVMGAVMSGKLTGTFKAFTDEAKKDLITIGAGFVPIISRIMAVAGSVMNDMTPVFKRAADIIGPALENIADTLLRAFDQPAVKQSIIAIAQAFTDILNALAPDLPGMMKSLAEAITRIAEVIAKNPKAFADFINFLVQIVIFVLNAIAVLTELATFMETTFAKNLKGMVAAWGNAAPEMQHIWSVSVNAMHAAWSWFVNFFVLGGHQMEMDWNAACGNIHGWWSNTVNFLHKAWSDFINFFVVGGHNIEATWNSVCGNIHNAWSNTVNFLHSVWSSFINFLSGSFSWMHSAWSNVCNFMHSAWSNTVNALHSIWSGFVNFLSSTMSFMHSIWSNVCNAISGAWNATVGAMINAWNSFYGAIANAINTMTGWFSRFFGWVKQGAHDAFGWMGSVGSFISHPFGLQSGGMIPGYGGGDRVPALLEAGELVLPKEAASHPMAAALASAYGVPGFQLGGIVGDIVNLGKGALGQIAGQVSGALTGPEGTVIKTILKSVLGTILRVLPGFLNEAATEIGKFSTDSLGFQRGGIVMDSGGWLPPGATTVYNFTGGPEHLVPSYGGNGGGGSVYHAHFDGLTGAAIESHVQTAFVAMSLRDGALHRQGRRQ
jgi:hypothetical protein